MSDESVHNGQERCGEIENIYKSAPVGLCVFDTDLRYVRINERLAEINGVPLRDHIGKHVRDVVPELAPLAETIAERIFRTGNAELNVGFSGTTKSKPGVFRYWIEHWQPLKDHNGKITGINVVAEEITDLKNARAALQKSHDELEKRVQERTAELQVVADQRDFLSRKLVDLLERQQTEIGNALHDEIAQIMTGVSLQLEGLKDSFVTADKIEYLQAQLRKAVSHARDISNNLRSEVLKRFGLLSSIKELVDQARRKCDINVRLFTRDFPEDVEKTTGLAVYRLIQEGMTNILKHADAQNVHINLSQRDGKLFVAIEDDGEGFEYGTIEERQKSSRQHLGITIMRERTSMVGGKFQIHSSPGKGTYMSAEIPLTNLQHAE